MLIGPYDETHAASLGDLLVDLGWYSNVFDHRGRRADVGMTIAYVALINGDVAGYIDGHVEANPLFAQPDYPSSTQTFVSFVGTAKAHRGRGVGRALLRAFAGDVEDQGFSYVTVSVASAELGWTPGDHAGTHSAEEARTAFFEACGFEWLDVGDHYSVMGASTETLRRQSGAGLSRS